jgi:hypothetical protein
MACLSLEEIQQECERNSGGLVELHVGLMDSIVSITEDATTWEVTAMTVDEANVSLNIKRRTSNYVEDEQNDFVNGSNVVTQTITAMIHRRDAAKSRAINIMGAGQRYMYVIALDNNGKYWYFKNVQLQSVGEGSGQERADGSKYALTFVAENDHLAYEIDSTVAQAVINFVS